MVPRDKPCLFRKGCSGEIPVKREGEACQKLWNLSQALGRFPAVGVKHTIHLICFLFQMSCCSAKGEAAAGSSGAHCSRACGLSLCSHFPGVGHESPVWQGPLGPSVLLVSLGMGMLMSSAARKQQCLLLTSWESPYPRQRDFFTLSYSPPNSYAHLNARVWHGSGVGKENK